jgi:short-subunit dehydrogenase
MFRYSFLWNDKQKTLFVLAATGRIPTQTFRERSSAHISHIRPLLLWKPLLFFFWDKKNKKGTDGSAAHYSSTNSLMDFLKITLQNLANRDRPHLGHLVLSSFFAYRSLSFLCSAWKYVRPLPNLKVMYPNSWAVITGATGGIGLSIARELAKAGLNLILLARDLKTLEQTADELMLAYPHIEVVCISADAASPDFEMIMKTIALHPISILVNNVGVINQLPANTDDLTLEEIARIVQINCTFHVQLTAMVLPFMKSTNSSFKYQPKIVNISSLTSKMAMPLYSVYSASKAFIDHWSMDLAAELEPEKISVVCLRPGLTVSAMSGETVPSLFVPSAETMARACVRMITNDGVTVVPYLPHLLLDSINALVPTRFAWSAARDMNSKKRNQMLLQSVPAAATATVAK